MIPGSEKWSDADTETHQDIKRHREIEKQKDRKIESDIERHRKAHR